MTDVEQVSESETSGHGGVDVTGKTNVSAPECYPAWRFEIMDIVNGSGGEDTANVGHRN